MASTSDGRTVTPVEMAQALRISEQELVQLTRSGVIHRTSEVRNGRQRIVYDWRIVVGEYIDHKNAPAEQARRDYLQEKHMTQQIVRASKELELANARGQLVDGEKVDREVMNMLSSIKNHMRALPSRVSSLLEGKSKAEIRAIMKKYVDLVLRESGELDLVKLRKPSQRNGSNGHSPRAKTKTRARS